MLSSAVNRARAARSNDKGFTLIELLIVIVILGILAAIVVFSVRGITDRGDASACKANESTARVAVEAYYAQEGDYPATLAAAVAAGFIASDPGAGTVDAAIRVAYGYVAATAGPPPTPATYTLANGTAC